MRPSFTRMTWLPLWRSIVQPAFSKIRAASAPLKTGAGPSDRDLDLLRFHCQGHSSIRPHCQAGRNRFADILDRLATGLALRNAAGNARAFRNPHAVFVLRQRDKKFHVDKFISPRIRRQKLVTRAFGGVPHQAHEALALPLQDWGPTKWSGMWSGIFLDCSIS